jgi:hypothetical protein
MKADLLLLFVLMLESIKDVGRVGYQHWEKRAKFSVNGVNVILYGQMCICIGQILVLLFRTVYPLSAGG